MALNCAVTQCLKNDECGFASPGVRRMAIANWGGEKVKYTDEDETIVSGFDMPEGKTAPKFYEIQCGDNTVTFESALQVNNGSKWMTETVNGTIAFLPAEAMATVRAMILGKFWVEIELNNGSKFLLGANGMKASTFTIASGDDSNGFNIAFTFDAVAQNLPLILEDFIEPDCE